MSTWRTVEVKHGYAYEELVGDPQWEGYRVTRLPGAPLPPAPARQASHHDAPRPLVTAAGCIPTCRRDAPHERWECELLATTAEEWVRILA